MWMICMLLSMGCVIFSLVLALSVNRSKLGRNHKISLFNALFAGTFLSVVVLFLPIHGASAEISVLGIWRTVLLSVFNAMQVFTHGCGFSVVSDGLAFCPDWLDGVFQIWAATLFVISPIYAVGFVLSLFRNISAYLRYLGGFWKDAYIFSELNEKSLTLARDIRDAHEKAVIVFTSVAEGSGETTYEQISNAKKLGAVCFRKDMLTVKFTRHSRRRELFFFAMGGNETDNLTLALKLIEAYKTRRHTHLYVFSTKIESQLLLTAVDKGHIKVRRVNEVQSLVNRMLYEQGQVLFQSAAEDADGGKHISAVVVGMGRHGTELVKALCWFGQMDGYSLEIHAFDKDPLAEDKFTALAPELMSSEYNGISVAGEAQYKITIHSGIQAGTNTFAEEIRKIKNATYVIVALGSDDVNINTAVDLRMYFERLKIHPVIQTIVYNSRQKQALQGIKNYRGQSYDIDFIGDMEISYSEEVIMNSELEGEALRSHMKWGKEEAFWNYEYNYRSSIAAAIHRKARVLQGITGADKAEEDLTAEERSVIEPLEHRRWNAYMRAEGYIFSGSKDPASRNDLAKTHHDLVDFSELSEEEKRKDSRVGAIRKNKKGEAPEKVCAE